MKRLIKNRKKVAYDGKDMMDFVIPTSPIYPQDYFKQRDPERLKKNKELHDKGQHKSFDELLQDEMDNLMK
jgi:cytidylate kinase